MKRESVAIVAACAAVISAGALGYAVVWGLATWDPNPSAGSPPAAPAPVVRSTREPGTDAAPVVARSDGDAALGGAAVPGLIVPPDQLAAVRAVVVIAVTRGEDARAAQAPSPRSTAPAPALSRGITERPLVSALLPQQPRAQTPAVEPGAAVPAAPRPPSVVRRPPAPPVAANPPVVVAPRPAPDPLAPRGVDITRGGADTPVDPPGIQATRGASGTPVDPPGIRATRGGSGLPIDPPGVRSARGLATVPIDPPGVRTTRGTSGAAEPAGVSVMRGPPPPDAGTSVSPGPLIIEMPAARRR